MDNNKKLLTQLSTNVCEDKKEVRPLDDCDVDGNLIKPPYEVPEPHKKRVPNRRMTQRDGRRAELTGNV